MSARETKTPRAAIARAGTLGLGGWLHGRTAAWLGLAAGLWLLNFSVTFHNVWPTLWITTWHELSIEIGVLLLVLVLWTELRGPPSGRVLTVLAVVLLIMSIGRYAEVTAPALYGRRINLYWDSQYLPDVFAMMVRAVPAWLIAAGVVALGGLLAAVFALLRWSLGRVARSLASAGQRRAVGALGGGLVVVFMLGVAGVLPTLRWYALPVTGTYKQQFQFIADALMERHNGGEQLPAPVDFGTGPLPRVDGSDVLLIFLESYGATTYDNPAMEKALVPYRDELAKAVADTGRYAASAFVTSPTFGGGSWLAHSSLMTGTQIKDNGVYSLLLTQHRDTLARRFKRNGYRAIAIMPGLKNAWPEGSFYGFDRIYGEDDLAYHGPEFGWWKIPDQYTLAKLDRMALSKSPRQPLFVFMPTVSTHIPFRPTAPYQPDWSRMLGDKPFVGEPLAQSLAKGPEWTNLAPGYVGAVQYTFQYWAGYLRLRPDADFVLIMLGDHQPASSVSGEGARHDVPVHVISKRRDIIDTLERAGFREGFYPNAKSIGPMNSLAKLLISDFAAPKEDADQNGSKTSSSPVPNSPGATQSRLRLPAAEQKAIGSSAPAAKKDEGNRSRS